VLHSDGSGLRRLPNTRGGSEPAWSPDGRLLAFTRTRAVPSGGVSDLYVVRPDGSGLRLVVRDAGAPAWSPDARSFVFMRSVCGGGRCGAAGVDNPYELFTVRTDGTGLRRLTDDGAYQGNPDWAPDGKRIVYELDDGLATTHLDGSHVRRLTHRYHTNPAWSVDGKTIAFDTFAAIYVLRVADGKVTRLTHAHAPHFAPAWSPDGRRIAYLGKPAGAYSAEDPLQVRVMPAAGGAPVALTPYGFGPPAWGGAE
jgi:TolB protein